VDDGGGENGDFGVTKWWLNGDFGVTKWW